MVRTNKSSKIAKVNAVINTQQHKSNKLWKHLSLMCLLKTITNLFQILKIPTYLQKIKLYRFYNTTPWAQKTGKSHVEIFI